MLTQVIDYLQQLQDNICMELSAIDGAEFISDDWQSAIGKGTSKVLTDGKVIERGGVNFSVVSGERLPAAATAKRTDLADCKFSAAGVSLVIHPRNPFAPTSHANVRFFIAENPQGDSIWWFGGGFDLTPYYAFVEDCIHWHQVAKQACDPFGDDLYEKYKQWADNYFYIKHRNECRGIGGLFFDDVNTGNFDNDFAFMRSVGDNYLPAYLPLLSKRKDTPYNNQQREFQLYRRGRYVEFNLIYDRGTLFGLQSNGRTESILMSMPPLVNWKYNWQPEPGSNEARLQDFLVPKAWVTEQVVDEFTS